MIAGRANESPLDLCLAGMTGAVSVCSLIGHAGGAYWLADLFSHFRPQYAVLLCLALLLHLARGQRILAGLAATLLGVNAALLAPLYLTSVPAASQADDGVSIIQFNVLRNNKQVERGIEYLRASRSDLILLQEFDPRWADAMRLGLSDYAVVLSEPRTTHFGMALYLRRDSGFTVRAARLLGIDDEGWRHPAIEVELEGRGRRFSLLGVHAHPPLNKRVAWIQSVELERAAAWSRDIGMDHLIVGDLNATPWSALYRKLTRETGLVSARDGFGIVASWYPLAGLSGGLPLDHVLHSDSLAATAFVAGPELGSDHRPIFARLRWQRPATEFEAPHPPARAPTQR
jgi:endonuclease/exonuclease/phosphatase (EEP) superfamily protein YafD